MDPLVLAALAMVLLHRADGGEVVVIPAHVTALHSRTLPVQGKNKLIHPDANCVVWLADGKRLSVVETCEVVKRLLDKAATE